MEISNEYKAVKHFIDSGESLVFVTGGAGTGKSTLIQWIKRQYDNVLVAAPTGIAAINVNGKTIHSLFRFPASYITEDDIKYLGSDNILRQATVLIIDEVSMVNANMIDAIDSSLKKNRGNKKLFGGLTVVMVGDLFQLPPVVTSTSLELFEANYKTPRFFSAKCLKGVNFNPVFLEKTYRQKDSLFIEILNSIREGNDINKYLDLLNSKVTITNDIPPESVVLSPRNKEVDAINSYNLRKLKTEERTYIGKVTGNFSEDRTPAPIFLDLKVGAQVMFLKNDSAMGVVNGSLGTVKKIADYYIDVILHSTKNIINVKKTTWENYNYNKAGSRIIKTIIGTYEQFPLKPSWALTIHKSQGQTIDKVHVDLGAGSFEVGQTYVALSRCTSLEGLSISRPLKEDDIIIDRVAIEFYNRLRGKIL